MKYITLGKKERIRRLNESIQEMEELGFNKEIINSYKEQIKELEEGL